MGETFDLDREKELIVEEVERIIRGMMRYADQRMVDRTWALEQFRRYLNKELSNDD